MTKEEPRDPPTCFVIGPIDQPGSDTRKHADMLLNLVIKEVLEKEPFDYRVKRGDEDADPGMIGDRMINDVLHADLVVADLTDLNPNAFYELGIRHAAQKPVIHMARVGTNLPFDTISQRTIFVDLSDFHSIKEARDRLNASTTAINRPEYKVSNPLTQANASFYLSRSADPKDQIISSMEKRLARLETSGRIFLSEDNTNS